MNRNLTYTNWIFYNNMGFFTIYTIKLNIYIYYIRHHYTILENEYMLYNLKYVEIPILVRFTYWEHFTWLLSYPTRVFQMNCDLLGKIVDILMDLWSKWNVLHPQDLSGEWQILYFKYILGKYKVMYWIKCFIWRIYLLK